eukprot:RCo015822
MHPTSSPSHVHTNVAEKEWQRQFRTVYFNFVLCCVVPGRLERVQASILGGWKPARSHGWISLRCMGALSFLSGIFTASRISPTSTELSDSQPALHYLFLCLLATLCCMR